MHEHRRVRLKHEQRPIPKHRTIDPKILQPDRRPNLTKGRVPAGKRFLGRHQKPPLFLAHPFVLAHRRTIVMDHPRLIERKMIRIRNPVHKHHAILPVKPISTAVIHKRANIKRALASTRPAYAAKRRCIVHALEPVSTMRIRRPHKQRKPARNLHQLITRNTPHRRSRTPRNPAQRLRQHIPRRATHTQRIVDHRPILRSDKPLRRLKRRLRNNALPNRVDHNVVLRQHADRRYRYPANTTGATSNAPDQPRNPTEYSGATGPHRTAPAPTAPQLEPPANTPASAQTPHQTTLAPPAHRRPYTPTPQA